ncbi:MAG: hypothetical protein IPJ14_14670 [Kineosporiaceae bacterium]|nr:hypothetical protein [Kineosporiaceae bacterium]
MATHPQRAWFTDAGETEPLPLAHLNPQLARPAPVANDPVEAVSEPPEAPEHTPPQPGVRDLRDELFGGWTQT